MRTRLLQRSEGAVSKLHAITFFYSCACRDIKQRRGWNERRCIYSEKKHIRITASSIKSPRPSRGKSTPISLSKGGNSWVLTGLSRLKAERPPPKERELNIKANLRKAAGKWNPRLRVACPRRRRRRRRSHPARGQILCRAQGDTRERREIPSRTHSSPPLFPLFFCMCLQCWKCARIYINWCACIMCLKGVIAGVCVCVLRAPSPNLLYLLPCARALPLRIPHQATGES
jgi:hypothetical protein